MANFSSFTNEHTVEYILIPHLVKALEAYYETIIPLYFWSTREGGRTALDMMGRKKFKVIAIYPRRPKLDYTSHEHIYVKLNFLLFERAKELLKHRIPVFAGVPLVNCLSNLRMSSKCELFYLKAHGTESVYCLSLKDANIFDDGNIKSVSVSSVQDLIDGLCQSMTWEESTSVIKNIKYTSNHYARFYGDLYKPVYLLIK